jgi:hypothetical protein
MLDLGKQLTIWYTLLSTANCVLHREIVLPPGMPKTVAFAGKIPMVAQAVEDIDLFNIAGRSISG